MTGPSQRRVALNFIPHPAGDDYPGHWQLQDTVKDAEIAVCQDLNWARWIMFALNEAINAGRIKPDE